MALKFWSVRRKSNSYGFISTLAETKEEAVAIAQAQGHPRHDRAKRAFFPGNQTMLSNGTFLANLTYTTTADGNDHPGWAILQKAGGRGGYQQEVVRFITEDEAVALTENAN